MGKPKAKPKVEEVKTPQIDEDVEVEEVLDTEEYNDGEE
jgi:hypothetical protein